MRHTSLALVAFAFAMAAAPALAIAPNCQSQIDALKANVAEQPKAAAEASVRTKLNEAQRLCSENKDEEAQAMARDVRRQLDASSKAGGEASGSSAAPPVHKQQ